MHKRQFAFNLALFLALIIVAIFFLNACDGGGGRLIEPEDVFEDDFEGTDCLSKWTVGGRQQEGTNISNCEMRKGSSKGHLFKFSFTEITLTPTPGPFPFSKDLIFNFEMEVRVSSTGGAPSNFYGSSGVVFNFYNSVGTFLGSVSYLVATTEYPFQSVANEPTRSAIKVAQNVNISYSLLVEEILSHIDIDETEIATVEMSFVTYSSTRPIPYVEAELWIDNVSVMY